MAFLNEDDIAENVKNFPVSYDKSNDDFHGKDVKKNAWTKAVGCTGIEDSRLCLQ